MTIRHVYVILLLSKGTERKVIDMRKKTVYKVTQRKKGAFRFLYFEKEDDAFSFYRFNFGTEFPEKVKMYKEEAFKKCFRTYRELSIMGEERWISEN